MSFLTWIQHNLFSSSCPPCQSVHPCASPDLWRPWRPSLPHRDILWSDSAPSHQEFWQHRHPALPVRLSGRGARVPPGVERCAGLWTSAHCTTRSDTVTGFFRLAGSADPDPIPVPTKIELQCLNQDPAPVSQERSSPVPESQLFFSFFTWFWSRYSSCDNDWPQLKSIHGCEWPCM